MRSLLALVLVSLLAGACSGDRPTLAPDSLPEPEPLAFADELVDDPDAGWFTMAVAGDVEVLPWDIDDASVAANAIADLLYDGLTTIDQETGRAAPALAESWTVSDDGLVWTFVLSADATKSSGAPVTPADVVGSLSKVSARADELVVGVALTAIEGYQTADDDQVAVPSGLAALDERTIEITLTEPLALLAEILAAPVLGIAGESSTAESPVTTGPLTLAEPDGDGIVRLAADDAGIAGVEVVSFDSTAAAYAAVGAGEADWAVVPAALAEPTGEVVTTPGTSTVFYGINVGRSSFADVDLRRALLLAVDSQMAQSAMGLEGSVADGLSADDVVACGERCSAPDQAAELLDGRTLEPLTVDYFVDDDGHEEALAMSVAESLRAVGFEVGLRPHAFDDYRQLLASGEHQVFRYGAVAHAASDATLGWLFARDGVGNVFAVADDELDALIATAAASGEDGDYAAVENRAIDLGIVIPIAQLDTRVILGVGVEGYYADRDGTVEIDGLTVAS